MGALYDGWMILAALVPSIGLLFLFWVILKHLVEGDRRERAAIRRWEAEQDAARAAASRNNASSSASKEIPESQKKGRGSSGDLS